MMLDKGELFDKGLDRIREFCRVNSLIFPEVFVVPAKDWPYNTCAYYRPVGIHICISKCAAIGVAGMAWSYPGNTVDRTPFGVLAHELGHHSDCSKSRRVDRYRGEFSVGLRRESGEEKLTNYCPDDGEWYAEMFRLFVTNPDLLRLIRRRTHRILSEHFVPVEHRPWNEVLRYAPERTQVSAQRKIVAAQRQGAAA